MTTYRTAHIGQGVFGAFQSRSFRRENKVSTDVCTELQGDANGHDEIDQRNGIQFDIPQVHHANHITGDPRE